MKKFIITEKLSNNLKNSNFLWLDFIKNSQKDDKKILKIVEEEAGIELSGGVTRALKDSSSIHVSFTPENTAEIEHENKEFKRVGISAQQMTREEIDFMFSSNLSNKT